MPKNTDVITLERDRLPRQAPVFANATDSAWTRHISHDAGYIYGLTVTPCSNVNQAQVWQTDVITTAVEPDLQLLASPPGAQLLL